MTAVELNFEALKYVRNQTVAVCLAAIRRSPRAMEFVRDQTPDLCQQALTINARVVDHIRNLTREQCEYAVKFNFISLKNLPKALLSDDMILNAFRKGTNQRWSQFVHLKDKISSDLVLRIIHECPNIISRVDNATPEMHRIAFNRGRASSVIHLSDATTEDYMQAVGMDGYVIRIIPHKTKSLCERAVLTTPQAIKFVDAEFQTETMCLHAVTHEASMLQYVASDHQTPKVCLLAVEHDPDTLEFVKDQTSEVCRAAICASYKAFKHMRVKTYEMFMLFLELRSACDESTSDSDS